MSELTGSEVVLTFLGTGASIPPTNRQQVSFSLVHPKGTILFDCGEGSQYQIRKKKVPVTKNLVIVISHIHSDHTLGLPGLLSSFQLQGRSEKVTIIGPPGMLEFMKNVMYAFYVSVSFEIEVIELKPGSNHRGENYTMFVHKALHDSPGGALSFIWQESDGKNKFNTDKLDEMNIPRGPHLKELQRGRSITINGKTIKPEDVMFKGRRGRVVAYSGDTSPNKKYMSSMPAIVDVLIHEASYPIDMEDMADERGHSTIKQAASMAKLANISKLYLIHITPRFTFSQLKKELKEVKKIFENTEIASDGQSYILHLPDFDIDVPI